MQDLADTPRPLTRVCQIARRRDRDLLDRRIWGVFPVVRSILLDRNASEGSSHARGGPRRSRNPTITSPRLSLRMESMRIVNRLLATLSISFFGSVASAETWTRSGMLSGANSTKEGCGLHPDTAVWVESECIRYFHRGLGPTNAVVHVWMHGDRMSQDRQGGRFASPSYRNASPQKQQMEADIAFEHYRVPQIYLSRPGVYGSSGSHAERRQPRNVNTVLAAFNALKAKYGIKKFAISGQSGGGHLVGAVLANRNDILCAAATSGGLSVQERVQWFGWSADATGYATFYDPIDYVKDIPKDPERRIFVIGDPRDKKVPFAIQRSYYRKVRAAGHMVSLIEAHAHDAARHALAGVGFQVIKWCVDGASTAEILDRAKLFAPWDDG